MDLLYIRIICMVILFLISGVFFMLPLFIKKMLHKRRHVFDMITKILNCVSSGIFFGIITLDLWPAAIEEFNEEINERKIEINFPVAQVLIGLGFFLIFMIEEFQDYFVRLFNHLSGCVKKQFKLRKKSIDGISEKRICVPSIEVVNNAFSIEIPAAEAVNSEPTKQHHHEIQVLDSNHQEHDPHHHHHNHNHDLHHNTFIVLISLSAHSFFDGLLLGVQDTEKDMWSFLFIVALHHSIMSFSVGTVSSSNSNLNDDSSNNRKIIKKHVTMTLVWSFIIPLGIFVTLFRAQIDKLVVAVLMNIATGSFLYITFIELLPQSITTLSLPYKLDIVFILFGYAIICLLEYIGE